MFFLAKYLVETNYIITFANVKQNIVQTIKIKKS